VWDAFLIDSDFKIERPKRYYRKGLNLFHSDASKASSGVIGNPEMLQPQHDHGDKLSLMGTVRSGLSQLFHIGIHHEHQTENGEIDDAHDPDEGSQESGGSSHSSSASSRPPTPMIDPSTNTDPLLGGDEQPEQSDLKGRNVIANNQKQKSDVSKHTFYIENSQTRLKLFARNEVRHSPRVYPK
jgi:phospholipase D1/2